MTQDMLDPKGLIREAYRIDGITQAECRSIFLDWALSHPEGRDTGADIASLLKQHEAETAHPMTQVLTEGMGTGTNRDGTRRGGRKARLRN